MDSRDVGRRVRSARESRGLDQIDIAGLAGLSRAYVSRLESGAIVNPKLLDLEAVASALRVPLDELLYEPRSLTEDEQQELARYLTDPEARVEFATTAKSMRDWTDEEKRSVLDVLRTMREMIDNRRGR